MSGCIRNKIETGIPTSLEDCREIAKALFGSKDLKVTKLCYSHIETSRGYRVEYICDPVLEDFLEIIDRDGWFICECESNWEPPNHLFKEIVARHPEAVIINIWIATTADGCHGNDEWNKDNVGEIADED